MFRGITRFLYDMFGHLQYKKVVITAHKKLSQAHKIDWIDNFLAKQKPVMKYFEPE